MRLITILFLFIATSGAAQTRYIPLGAGTAQDTSKLNGSLFIPYYLMMPAYKTADTNKVLGVDAYGRIVLRTKSNGSGGLSPSDSEWVELSIYDAVAMQAEADSTALADSVSNKQNLVTLTANGTSGPATFDQNTGALNIPQYAGNPGTVTSINATGGTGISVAGGPITSLGTFTVTNTAPDQTVVLSNGTGISVAGTYPNFTVTNTSPNQTVNIAAGTGISIGGPYPTYTVTNTQTSLPPSGSAGGDLAGTYPNPTVAGTVVKSVVLNTPNVIFTTPVTFSTSTNTATGTLSLNNQNPRTFLGGALSGTVTPSFRQIDTLDLPPQTPTKFYVNNLIYMVGNVVTTNTHTGNTTETIIDSIFVTGGLVGARDKIRIEAALRGTASGNKTFRLYINSASNLSGATLAGTYQQPTNANYNVFSRVMFMKGATNSILFYPGSTTALTENTAATTQPSPMTIDFSTGKWFLFTVQLANGVDVAGTEYFNVTILKGR